MITPGKFITCLPNIIESVYRKSSKSPYYILEQNELPYVTIDIYYLLKIF